MRLFPIGCRLPVSKSRIVETLVVLAEAERLPEKSADDKRVGVVVCFPPRGRTEGADLEDDD
jgi:hypothetical protein